MSWLIFIGTVITVIGFLGLLMSMFRVIKAKRHSTSEEELREQIKRAMPLNLGSLFLSVFGLMGVVCGILSG